MSPRQALKQFKEFVRIFGLDGESCLDPKETGQALIVLGRVIREAENSLKNKPL